MSSRSKTLPPWVILSLATNAVLSLTVSLLLLQHSEWTSVGQAEASVTEQTSDSPEEVESELGPRHQLTYEEWVEILEREAQAIATAPPERLSVLAGDSIALWFPAELLPSDTTWLNQGISGETTDGLFERLKLLDDTNPEAIFVSIGINDLIRGVEDEVLLDNYWRIIRDLREHHPDAQIIVHSILPHSGENATWEGRDRLLELSNDRIRELNRELEQLAEAEGAKYLNLSPLLTDENGNLDLDFTTDGLHLNEQGYLVWRSALQLYRDLELANAPIE
ncbi:MAG: SGNH/GDSL hydrolase family protein [Cyanobacteriota bacterium]|nr:SGNH/GDSL hydrolase family protein [Cyanobacteriota bacterium]